MDVCAYLNRIGYTGAAEPTLDALIALQRAHLYAVPYENLDILNGIPLSLSREALFEKIVSRRRGGYCFELNELFGWLLRDIGFGVTDLFARFLRGESEIPMRRHHVLWVTIPGTDGAWLCDAGVGNGSPTQPVRIAEGMVQEQPDGVYRFSKDAFLGWILEERKRGDWERAYSFTEEAQLPVDYLAASFYCENAPESIFNKAEMLSLRTLGGRITLDGDVFRRFERGAVAEERIPDPEAKRLRILEWFGIDTDRITHIGKGRNQ